MAKSIEKDFEYRYDRYTKFSGEENGDKIVMNLKVKQELRDLLKTFAVAGRLVDISGTNAKRSLITGSLKTSLNWQPFFDLFFTEGVLKEGEVKVEFDSISAFDNYTYGEQYIRQFVERMYRLCTPQTTINKVKLIVEQE